MQSGKNNMLLVELLIVLLFFALSQAIVVQVFARAQQVNHAADLQNRTLSTAQNAAEALAVSEDPAATLQQLGFTVADGAYALAVEGEYTLSASILRAAQPAGMLTTVQIEGQRANETLFTLPACQYREVTAP